MLLDKVQLLLAARRKLRSSAFFVTLISSLDVSDSSSSPLLFSVDTMADSDRLGFGQRRPGRRGLRMAWADAGLRAVPAPPQPPAQAAGPQRGERMRCITSESAAGGLSWQSRDSGRRPHRSPLPRNPAPPPSGPRGGRKELEFRRRARAQR